MFLAQLISHLYMNIHCVFRLFINCSSAYISICVCVKCVCVQRWPTQTWKLKLLWMRLGSVHMRICCDHHIMAMCIRHCAVCGPHSRARIHNCRFSSLSFFPHTHTNIYYVHWPVTFLWHNFDMPLYVSSLVRSLLLSVARSISFALVQRTTKKQQREWKNINWIPPIHTI